MVAPQVNQLAMVAQRYQNIAAQRGSSMFLVSVVINLGMLPAMESWGIDGHHVICKITESRLSDTASTTVKDLLPDDLDSLCS